MRLADLSAELVQAVADILTQKDMWSFARTSNIFYQCVIPVLYKQNARYDGSSALIWASLKGEKKTVLRSLYYGADVNAGYNKANLSRNPAQRGNLEIIGMINDAGGEGWTALSWAVYFGHHAVLQELLNAGAEVGDTALIAAAKGSCEAVRLLLEVDVDINRHDRYGDTALILASSHGFIEVVRLLLDMGADIHHSGKNGDTALINAAIQGCYDVVELLLERGANVDLAGNDGTALMAASYYGHAEVARLLLKKGANVDEVDDDGSTALIWATVGDRLEAVQTLLQGGAEG